MSLPSSSWLTVELVEKILRNVEGDESIEVKDSAVGPVVGKGDNYGSEMVRVTVNYLRCKAGCNVMEKKSVIFKSEPSEDETIDDTHKKLLDSFGVFETEINMMETTLRRMNDVLNDRDHRFSAHVIYTEIGKPSFLAIDDLTALGYRMGNKLIGLDLEHCLITMRQLAKFHASSVAVCEKDPKQKKMYNKGKFQDDYPEHWKDFYRSGIRTLANEVAKWSELGPSRHSYSEKLLNLSKVCYEKAIECVRQKNEFNVINHGDLWVNNIMFRYDDEGNVIDHIFVDFQLAFWNAPAIDIYQFFHTSTSEDVNINHLDDLLQEYHNTLTNTMASIRCTTKAPTLEALKKILSDYEFYGLMESCLMTPLTLFDWTKVAGSSNTIFCEGHGVNPVYLGESFRKIAIRRLPGWDARGLLDVHHHVND